MENETRNLQNEFFNTVRKDRETVTVYLTNGKKLVGRIKSFDKYTVLLESSYGEQIVFKHAISTVGTGGGRNSGGHDHDRPESNRRD